MQLNFTMTSTRCSLPWCCLWQSYNFTSQWTSVSNSPRSRYAARPSRITCPRCHATWWNSHSDSVQWNPFTFTDKWGQLRIEIHLTKNEVPSLQSSAWYTGRCTSGLGPLKHPLDNICVMSNITTAVNSSVCFRCLWAVPVVFWFGTPSCLWYF